MLSGVLRTFVRDAYDPTTEMPNACGYGSMFGKSL